MGEDSEPKKGRRIIKVSCECLEAFFKGDVIHCTEPLPEDAKLIGARKGFECVELSFESLAWSDITVSETCHVYPQISPTFCGRMGCRIGV